MDQRKQNSVCVYMHVCVGGGRGGEGKEEGRIIKQTGEPRLKVYGVLSILEMSTLKGTQKLTLKKWIKMSTNRAHWSFTCAEHVQKCVKYTARYIHKVSFYHTWFHLRESVIKGHKRICFWHIHPHYIYDLFDQGEISLKKPPVGLSWWYSG